jgi:acetoin utilization protein AcuB
MLVGDRMTKHPLTVEATESVIETHRYMQEQKIHHLPVVKRDGTMVGLVTEKDLLKAEPSQATSLSMWEINSLLNRIQVKDVMTRKVITTTEDTPIEEAAHMMLDYQIGCLPVKRGEKLVGIITESDLFRTFMELFAARQKGLRITLAVPDREGELAKVAQAIADQGGYIAACGAFQPQSPTSYGLVLKVRNTDRQQLIQTLSGIEEVEILDVRQV